MVDVVVAVAWGIVLTTDIWLLAIGSLLVVMAPYRLVADTIDSSEYAIYLARRAGSPPTGKRARTTTGGPPLEEFRYHMKAVQRIGDRRSGGYADDLVLLALPEEAWSDEKTRPKSFMELARAIELDLVEHAAALPAGQAWTPFAEYAEDLRKSLGRDSFSLPAWQVFVVRRYGSVSSRAKDLAKAHVPRPILDRLQSRVALLQVAVAAVVALSAYLLPTLIHYVSP